MNRRVGDEGLFGDVDGVTTHGFIRADTRIVVALPTGAVPFALHLGLASSCTFQADRVQLTRLRDILTEALDAEQEEPS